MELRQQQLADELAFRAVPATGRQVEALRVCALLAPPELQTRVHNLHVESQDLAERIVALKREVGA